MALDDASQQALLQASLKDDFYLQIIRNHFTNICQQFLGTRLWLSWKKELEILSDLFYFCLTTVKGSQTLGEEYAAIVQVDSSKRKIPSQIQRIFYILLNTTSPYLVEKCLGRLQQRIETSQDISGPHKKQLVVFIKLLQKLIPVLQKLHLLLFYLDGLYANVALRISKIKHVLIRPYNKNETDSSTFRWLAFMLTIQCTTALYTAFSSTKREMLDAAKDDFKCEQFHHNQTSSVQLRCMLCLEMIENASSTICGHVFCWKCIIDWCTVKPECPSCRERCPPSRVVKLHHFIFGPS